MTRYRHRLHAFKPAKIWTVSEEGVAWEDQDEAAQSGLIPWDKIAAIRLRFEPSRAETRRVGLHIYAPYDHHITNIHFQGVMDFKLQKPEFSAFVTALHDQIPEGSKVAFYKGSTKGAYIGNLALTVFILLLLLLIAPLVSLTGIPGATSILRLVMIVIFLPIIFKLLRVNRPGRYTPDDLPKELLE